MVVKPQGRVLLERFQPIKHRFGRPTPSGDKSALPLIDNLVLHKTDFARSKVEDGVLEITKFVTFNPPLSHSESNIR